MSFWKKLFRKDEKPKEPDAATKELQKQIEELKKNKKSPFNGVNGQYKKAVYTYDGMLDVVRVSTPFGDVRIDHEHKTLLIKDEDFKSIEEWHGKYRSQKEEKPTNPATDIIIIPYSAKRSEVITDVFFAVFGMTRAIEKIVRDLSSGTTVKDLHPTYVIPYTYSLPYFLLEEDKKLEIDNILEITGNKMRVPVIEEKNKKEEVKIILENGKVVTKGSKVPSNFELGGTTKKAAKVLVEAKTQAGHENITLLTLGKTLGMKWLLCTVSPEKQRLFTNGVSLESLYDVDAMFMSMDREIVSGMAMQTIVIADENRNMYLLMPLPQKLADSAKQA